MHSNPRTVGTNLTSDGRYVQLNLWREVRITHIHEEN